MALCEVSAARAGLSCSRIVEELRSGRLLDRDRTIAYASILLITEIVVFLYTAAGTHGWIVPLDRPNTTDFVSFYSAGTLADAGTPELAYDQARHYAEEQRVTEPGIEYAFFYYPPVFLLLCSALARLPYLPAFCLFQIASLIPYLLLARTILREKSWAVFLPLLAFPSVFWTLGIGQNSLLTASLVGAATLVIDRRPALAGLLFGLLCYKPHFGLLVPVALAAGGHWRAFATAAATVMAVVALSIGLFGWETWQAFFAAAAISHSTYEHGPVDVAAMVSPFGAVLLLGGSTAIAYAAQAAMAIIAAGFVAVVWRRRLSLPVRAAALAAATSLAIPVILMYDLMLAFIAVVWLVRTAREHGYLPWEKMAFAALFCVSVWSRPVGNFWHIPTAQVALLVLLGYVALAAWNEVASPSDMILEAR